jgi:3-oxoadipate enol-lactonase
MRHTLLLLHGFPHDHTLWEAQIQDLSQAADVLTPDLRGFGKGEEVPDAVLMEDYAHDLHVLLNAHGIQRAVLCGLSMGGYVSLAFLAHYPERASGLILCNTRATADSEEVAAAREATARDAMERGVPVIARGMLPKVLAAGTIAEQPATAQRIGAMMARQPARAVAAAARGMAQRPDRSAWLHTIHVPTLIITGDHDTLMPLPTSQAMHEAIPNSRLVVIPGAGHLSNVEQPERFNAEVRDFLRSL